MKRILVLTTITLIVAATALAGEGPRREERGGELGHYLQLTADQRAAWDSARNDFETAGAALFAKHRELMSQVEASLKTKADSARIVITDQAGNQARTLKGGAMKDGLAAGYNRVIWDLSIDPIPLPKGASPAPAGFFGGGGDSTGTRGPVVLPGDFKLSLIVNGKPVGNGTIAIKGDPDAVLDLKAILDRLYDEGGYDEFIYQTEPVPPLSAADAAWAYSLIPPGAPRHA